MKIAVLAKQVPDTRNVGKDAMTAEGTVNRAALDAIFNPEDMNALEEALAIKDKCVLKDIPCSVTVITMGPPRASQILKESLYRGADEGILLSDMKFAGADTLATSYALANALRKINPDIIFSGRQAIDGDTAQVGPQIAQELGLPQVTYAVEILDFNNESVKVKRALENGVESVESTLPALITVCSSAAKPRYANAKFLMKYKNFNEFSVWNVDTIGGDVQRYGGAGSPTRVKKIENIVFTSKEARVIEPDDASLEGLIQELISNHTIG